jgi:hypothetical protein
MKRVLKVTLPLVAFAVLAALAAAYALSIGAAGPAGAPATSTAVPATFAPTPAAGRQVLIYNLGLG